MENRSGTPKRFHSLDVLRGLAALAVVFWHWQHFFCVGTAPGPMDAERLPFHRIFYLAYARGGLAVDLFFVLSGFVFYWLYSTQVAAGRTSAFDFALRRFSRLYPLHLATLVLVALGQWGYRAAHGTWFVFSNNDAYHFVLNLLCASSWGFERGYSFNGPAWSISVEIALYAMFFLACRALPVRLVVLAAISLAGFLLVERHQPAIGRGVGSFFLGGCIYLVYRALQASPRAARISLVVAAFALVCWAGTLVAVALGVDARTFTSADADVLGPLTPAYRYIGLRVLNYSSYWVRWILFPATILSLVLLEATRGPIGKRLAFLGDISYSSYLLHFPLQLLFVSITSALGIDRTIYYEALTMMCFFAVLVAASFASYHCFEAPLQDRIRRSEVASRITRRWR